MCASIDLSHTVRNHRRCRFDSTVFVHEFTYFDSFRQGTHTPYSVAGGEFCSSIFCLYWFGMRINGIGEVNWEKKKSDLPTLVEFNYFVESNTNRTNETVKMCNWKSYCVQFGGTDRTQKNSKWRERETVRGERKRTLCTGEADDCSLSLCLCRSASVFVFCVGVEEWSRVSGSARSDPDPSWRQQRINRKPIWTQQTKRATRAEQSEQTWKIHWP